MRIIKNVAESMFKAAGTPSVTELTSVDFNIPDGQYAEVESIIVLFNTEGSPEIDVNIWIEATWSNEYVAEVFDYMREQGVLFTGSLIEMASTATAPAISFRQLKSELILLPLREQLVTVKPLPILLRTGDNAADLSLDFSGLVIVDFSLKKLNTSVATELTYRQ